MCGIVGGIAQRNIVPILLEGLKRLEYRGYDSAGLAVISDRKIYRKRELGKVKGLEELLQADPVSGNIGIAHTRWATHGNPVQLTLIRIFAEIKWRLYITVLLKTMNSYAAR